MFFLQLKRSSFFYLILALIITFVFLTILAKAEEEYLLVTEKLPKKNIELTNQVSDENYEIIEEEDVDYESQRRNTKNPLYISDKVFTQEKSLTTNDLIKKVSLIVFVLLGVLFLIKIFLSKRSFSEPGSLFDRFTNKISNAFLNTSTVKLVQTLVLIPGQNLYVIEVEGKKLLIGGTQNGVQFLADLTSKFNLSSSSGNLSFKQIDDLQGSQGSMQQVPFTMTSGIKVNEPIKIESEENNAPQIYSKSVFKRRINYKQSLLNKTNNGQEYSKPELVH